MIAAGLHVQQLEAGELAPALVALGAGEQRRLAVVVAGQAPAELLGAVGGGGPWPRPHASEHMFDTRKSARTS